MNDPNRISLADLPSAISLVHQCLQPDAHSKDFRHSLEKAGPDIRINYDENALAFNRAFFIRNYLKCAIYLRMLAQGGFRAPRFAVDLGGGAGPFSLALRQYAPETKTVVVDRNSPQVAIGWALSRVIGLQHISTAKVSDIFQINLDTQYLRLISYWVCENTKALAVAPAARPKIFGRHSILVDYPEIVRAEADRVSQFGGRAMHLTVTQKAVCSHLERMIGQSTITFGGVCVEYPEQ